MKTVNHQQGTDAWLEHRANHHNASDAPAMFGVSPYETRQQLLHRCHTGEQREISPQLQRVFDKGHEVEALTRPIAQEIVGDDLFSATATDDQGWLSASFDGVTMDERVIWECKQYNKAKFAEVEAGRCPEQDYPQVQQQLLISGAEKCLYSVGDGTKEGTRTTWVEPDSDYQINIAAGWRQFELDLAEYEPPAETVEAVAKPIESLPSLHIEAEGKVLASNLDVYREKAMAMFDSINTELQTDQDFADAEETVKWCSDIEKRLESAKEGVLGQTASLDDLFHAIDDIKATARQKRLELDKLVKARKQQVRQEIRDKASMALNKHVEALNERVAPVRIPYPDSDFASAMKNKRTIQSLRDAVEQVLTDAKLEANELADRIDANLKIYRELADGFESLFPDRDQLVLKDADDFRAAVKLRISEHKEAEEKRKREEEDRIAKDAEKLRAAEESRPAEEQAKTAPAEAEAANAAVQTKQVTVVATFAAVVNAERSDEEVRGALERKLRAAGFQTLQSVKVCGGEA